MINEDAGEWGVRSGGAEVKPVLPDTLLLTSRVILPKNKTQHIPDGLHFVSHSLLLHAFSQEPLVIVDNSRWFRAHVFWEVIMKKNPGNGPSGSEWLHGIVTDFTHRFANLSTLLPVTHDWCMDCVTRWLTWLPNCDCSLLRWGQVLKGIPNERSEVLALSLVPNRSQKSVCCY